jgi:flagellar biosynthesis GTPase FlhF
MKKIISSLLCMSLCLPLLANTDTEANKSDAPSIQHDASATSDFAILQQVQDERATNKINRPQSKQDTNAKATDELKDKKTNKPIQKDTQEKKESSLSAHPELVEEKRRNDQKADKNSLKPKKIKIGQPDQNQEQWRSFLKSCSTSLFIGAFIGGLSGQASAYTVHNQCNYNSKPKKAIATIINWFLWSAARQAILEMIEEEMDTYHIKHNKTLLETTGYCSDWLSYVYAMYKIYK